MSLLTRRGFLAATSASAAALLLPAQVRAQSTRMTLSATSRTIEVQGKAATVWGLLDGNGRSGLVFDPGQAFAVDLTNTLDAPTIIHWHGQIPPNIQDGVPDLPMPMLQPGESRGYDFAARPGTHWMHAHIPEHEMLLLAAPLVVRRPEDVSADRQEVTLFLHDFSFRPPAEVLAEITGGTSMAGMDHSQMGQDGMAAMDMGAMGQGDAMSMPGMDGMAMDLNDYNFDAYLANDRTLDDPEVLQVDKGGRVLVRVINAAAATVFWIDTGSLPGRL
ncbi:MAG: multicopper oxidase domain-containing protein, partial [Cypionkella sp.]|nr:multicopper oxidase domain-containing protein [Cypionkella sp.]